ncbi:MAG: hypothetical protein HY568_00800 [Candidatus Latescibacteria bacterium]|nr:hypothetical protein [Candidatus Latescibacterota bacterium]
MLRHHALLLGAIAALACAAAPPRSLEPPQTNQRSFLGPTQMLFQDSDTVLVLVSKEWQAGSVRHQEKLLRHGVRLAYWLKHIPSDQRMVFDALGYPTGRLLLTPVGHSEEWWYYGQLAAPLRFRDGALVDRNLFDSYRGR